MKSDNLLSKGEHFSETTQNLSKIDRFIAHCIAF